MATFDSVASIIRRHGSRRPHWQAISFEGKWYTYGELDERSNQVAQALSALGVRRGDRVAYLDKNRPEYFDLMFGAAKLGAVITALNWRLAPSELAAILSDARPLVLVVGGELHAMLEKVAGALPALRILSLDEHPRWTSFTSLVDGYPAVDPLVPVGSDDVAFQLYTSGTTGRPKGVLTTNRGIIDGLMRVAAVWQLDDEAVAVAPNPLFHVAGTSWVLVALAAGARVVLQREVKPREILRSITEMGVTNAVLLPTILQMLLRLPEAADADFSSLKMVLYGSAPIMPPLLEEAMERLECDFVQQYGMTESTGPITCLMPQDHDPRGRPALLRSCGRVVPWAELQICDPETGAPRLAGTVGEIWTRSQQNTTGYFNKPAETAELIDCDGWMHTGDAGYVDADGYLYLTDRLKDMIVSGSENVYPTEVELVLSRHPCVEEVAVIGVPNEPWGEAVAAVIVPRQGMTLSVDELRDFAREYLAGYKLPKAVYFATDLPRNAAGKVLKNVLREVYRTGEDRHRRSATLQS